MANCVNYAFNIRVVPTGYLYAFDPRRIAILLLGGNKTGHDQWYEQFVPRADLLYEDHLKSLRQEE